MLVARAAGADDTSLPPGPRPIQVAAGLFLSNLSAVSERTETFNADLYLSLRWTDPRLVFEGTEPKRYLENAADERLKAIWWPQLEFVNTAQPHITNRTLDIAPDGSVRYELGLSAEFRTDLDLHRFPFDHQALTVRLQSFIWTRDQMVFVRDPRRIGFNPENTFEGLTVTGVATEIRESELTGWAAAESYSELVARIDVQRRVAFYVWTVFLPVILIFLISCTIFVVPREAFAARIGISLTALLACIAKQFTISFSLPQISYTTVIDRTFLVTYACIALGVLVSTLQVTLLRDRETRRIDQFAGFGLLLLFFLSLAIAVR